jgi:acyl dehydratase
MIDPKFIGLSGPEFEVPIERGKIREFAAAIGAHLPEYMEDRHAVVPPTFLVTAANFWGYLLEWPGDTPLREISVEGTMSLDAGQAFSYGAALPRAGDTLFARTEVEDIWHKTGRSGGRLSFIRMLTTFRDERGNIVAEWRPTSVQPDRPPERGVAHAPQDSTGRPFRGHVLDKRTQMLAIERMTDPETLSEGSALQPVTMPPLTLTDVVQYQFASGERSIGHHDDACARAEGFPSFFSIGMYHAGLLSTCALQWLGPANVRRFSSRFHDMIWPGDELTYRGRITRIDEEPDARWIALDLRCTRDDQTVASAEATFHMPRF